MLDWMPNSKVSRSVKIVTYPCLLSGSAFLSSVTTVCLKNRYRDDLMYICNVAFEMGCLTADVCNAGMLLLMSVTSAKKNEQNTNRA